MRLFITLFLLFFSNLFFNLAQATPHSNAVLPRKSGVATANKAVDDAKKNKTAKSAKKSASATPAKPAQKHTTASANTASHTTATSHTKAATGKAAVASTAARSHTASNSKKDKKEEKGSVAKSSQPAGKNAKKTLTEQAKNAHTQPTKVAHASAKHPNSEPHSGSGHTTAKNQKGKSATTHTATLAANAHHGKNKNDKMSKSGIAMNPAHQKRYQHAKQTAMNKLMSQIGKPYHWGGTTPYSGFDCSGLVYYAYKDVVKISIPRTANEMFHLRDAAPIKKSELESGDLVFFRITNRGAADHVGVYLGNGRFIQSPRTGSDIKISKLSEDYWQDHYVGARRVVTPKTMR
ncbi:MULTISPECIES: C40 family peptidase [unclassified Dickeya]|uniref:C40 family peptidase n=1 Tax=unclassified Dickeya TaxID=2622466 RepID=UPI0003AAAAB8|nr:MULTISPECIES: NlpC/P60 family protein [unclassified Dickeya]